MISRALANEISAGRVVTFCNVAVVLSHAGRFVNNKQPRGMRLVVVAHKTCWLNNYLPRQGNQFRSDL
jgi:hypothetical protein